VQVSPPEIWQVEAVRDALQEAIDSYVMLRTTADAVARYVEAELNKSGLTTVQYGVLLHLQRGVPLSLTELGARVFRSNSALTTLVDRLERDGIVTRADHAVDRRVTTLELTDKGRALIQEVRIKHRPFLADMMACLSPEELNQLSQLLVKIKRKVDDGECP